MFSHVTSNFYRLHYAAAQIHFKFAIHACLHFQILATWCWRHESWMAKLVLLEIIFCKVQLLCWKKRLHYFTWRRQANLGRILSVNGQTVHRAWMAKYSSLWRWLETNFHVYSTLGEHYDAILSRYRLLFSKNTMAFIIAVSERELRQSCWYWNRDGFETNRVSCLLRFDSDVLRHRYTSSCRRPSSRELAIRGDVAWWCSLRGDCSLSWSTSSDSANSNILNQLSNLIFLII